MTTRPEDAVPWISLEQELHQQTPRQWATLLKEASTNEFNRLLITLTRHATNTQIARLYNILEQQQNQHKQQLERWKATLTRLTPNFFSEQKRYKPTVSEKDNHWLIHFAQGGSTPGKAQRKPNPAVIGFTGNAGLLMAPVACILTALSQTPYDLVVIRRRYKESYFGNNGCLLLSICAHLQSQLRSQLKSSITLGTSSGGMAALCVADALRLPLGIAIGASADAEALQSNGTISNATKKLHRKLYPIHLRKRMTKLLLAAPADHQPDAKSSRLIRDHYNSLGRTSTTASTLLFSKCSNHGLLSELSEKGLTLDQLLLPMINRDIDILSEYLLDESSIGE